MESDNLYSRHSDIQQAELGEREKTAVEDVFGDVWKMVHTGIKPKDVKIRISQDKPFDVKGFVEALHKKHINVVDSLREVEEGCLVFTPRPLEDEEFHSILRDVIIIPDGLEKYFK